MAPEIILDQGYHKSVDLWSLGCLLYEMTTGYKLFNHQNLNKLYEKILFQKVDFNRKECNHLSSEIKNLLGLLLTRDVGKRINIKEVMQHSFFEGVKFEDVLNRNYRPPIIPQSRKIDELVNFDSYFTN